MYQHNMRENVRQFVCTKLSVNWKNKCIITQKKPYNKCIKIVKYFKNNSMNKDVTVIQNVKFYGENHWFQIFLPLSGYQ